MVNLAKMSGGLETTARIAVARFRPPSVSRRGGTEEERENSLIVYFRAERRGRIESNQALGFRSQKTARVRHAPLAAQFLAKLIITAFSVRAAREEESFDRVFSVSRSRSAPRCKGAADPQTDGHRLNETYYNE